MVIPDYLFILLINLLEACIYNKGFTMETIKSDILLTRKEVAKKLRVSYPTLKRWCDRKLIPSYKIGYVVRYKESDIDQLLNNSINNHIKTIDNE